MSRDPDCIFCKIVAGEAPCFKLLEDAETLAFMDISPVHDGHALIIPKTHHPTVFDIAPEAFAATARSTARISKAVNATLQPDGLNLIQANGPGAAQLVGHLHIHVLPRWHGDGLLVNWTLQPGDHARIAAIAEQIRQHLSA